LANESPARDRLSGSDRKLRRGGIHSPPASGALRFDSWSKNSSPSANTSVRRSATSHSSFIHSFAHSIGRIPAVGSQLYDRAAPINRISIWGVPARIGHVRFRASRRVIYPQIAKPGRSGATS